MPIKIIKRYLRNLCFQSANVIGFLKYNKCHNLMLSLRLLETEQSNNSVFILLMHFYRVCSVCWIFKLVVLKIKTRALYVTCAHTTTTMQCHFLFFGMSSYYVTHAFSSSLCNPGWPQFLLGWYPGTCHHRQPPKVYLTDFAVIFISLSFFGGLIQFLKLVYIHYTKW